MRPRIWPQMTAKSNPRLISSLKPSSQGASAVVILLGGLVLIGWALDIAALKSLLPGLPRMAANTALGILLSGASLWLQHLTPLPQSPLHPHPGPPPPEQGRGRQERGEGAKGVRGEAVRLLAQVCALIVALIGLLTLGEYLFGWDLGIDQLLFKDTTVGATYPGRPSPHTALTFVLVGLALLLLDVETPNGHLPAQFLALTAALIPLGALVGYVYNVSIFYGITAYTGMAVHTAIAFTLLCLGLLSAHSERGVMAVVTSGHFGGVMARRLLLAAVGIPIVLGWLRLKGEQAGFYDAFLGASLLALSSVVVFVVLIWATARSLNRTDVERQQAEAEMRKLSRVVEQTDDSVVVTNREGTIEYVNPAFERGTGYTREEALGQTPRILKSGKHSQDLYQQLWETVLAGRVFRAVLINKKKGGEVFYEEKTITPLKDSAGVITHLVSTGKDITERRQAEEERERLFAEVQAGRARLAALSARLINAQESERRRLARELHDEIGQALTGLRVILEVAAGLPAGSQALGARLKQALGLIEQVTGQVRDMSLQLRPSILDDLGLLPALLWHFERYSAQTNVRVAVEHRGLKDRRFAPEIETAAFRIVQEALTNVARHAGVGEATVRLWATRDTLGVQIEDLGRGFDPQVALTAGASSGLSGMQERALLLGGCLEVESSPGAGTRLTAELPLDGGPNERRERER